MDILFVPQSWVIILVRALYQFALLRIFLYPIYDTQITLYFMDFVLPEIHNPNILQNLLRYSHYYYILRINFYWSCFSMWFDEIEKNIREHGWRVVLQGRKRVIGVMHSIKRWDLLSNIYRFRYIYANYLTANKTRRGQTYSYEKNLLRPVAIIIGKNLTSMCHYF